LIVMGKGYRSDSVGRHTEREKYPLGDAR
jgi:hypothetical protein